MSNFEERKIELINDFKILKNEIEILTKRVDEITKLLPDVRDEDANDFDMKYLDHLEDDLDIIHLY